MNLSLFKVSIRKIFKDNTFLLVLAAGSLLRFMYLNQHDFWYDEAISHFIARHSLRELLAISARDTQPPLYYLFLHYWMKIGEAPWLLRLPSLILGVSTLALAVILLRNISTKKTALLTVTLLALSPLHIYFSTETRMYSLFTFVTLLVCILYINNISKMRWYTSLALAVSEIILALTHYFGLLIIGALTLDFIFGYRQHSKSKPWVVMQLLAFALIMSWYIWAFFRIASGCWCFPATVGLPTLMASFTMGGLGIITVKDIIRFAPVSHIILFASVTLLCLFLFIKGIKPIKKPTLPYFVFFAPLIFVVITSLSKPFFPPRAFVALAPFYYFFVAQGILYTKSSRYSRLFAAVVILGFLTITLLQIQNPFYQGPKYRQLAAELTPQDNTAILHLSAETLYPAVFYHKYAGHEYMMFNDANSYPALFDFGNFQADLSVLSQYQRLYLVVIPARTSVEELNMLDRNLDFVFTRAARTFCCEALPGYNSVSIYLYEHK